MKVEIYSTPSCPQCDVTKNFLKSKQIEYIEHVVGQTAQKQDIEDRCNCTVRTVPQIFVNDEYVSGGLNELRQIVTNK